jgi:hypothetical protein
VLHAQRVGMPLLTLLCKRSKPYSTPPWYGKAPPHIRVFVLVSESQYA